MVTDRKILIGAGENPVYLLPEMTNRHGLIAGATGTGKTVTMKVLAEGLSNMGVPVFMADVKGDVSSMSTAGEKTEKIISRLEKIGADPDEFEPQAFPVRFWDVYGSGGIPVRATVSDIGPMLLSRLLGLTPAQTGVLNIAFRLADDDGLELLDFKDLKAILTYVGEIRGELTNTYGNVSAQSVGAIQRALLSFEDQGADVFLGEPDFQIEDWFQLDEEGHGYVNILHCAKLVQNPLLYSTFMLWMLSELYENLPEVGDLEKPKLVFFFDEAHTLFKDTPKALLDKITQVVKLIRSKGVGIFFISQSPSDIPDEVLAQLNNRIQHALHAYTPSEQKAVKAASMSFRPNPAFKTEDVLAALGTGEALVSMLDENGAPVIVEKAVIAPPQCSFTALSESERTQRMCDDPIYPKYKDPVDNRSAYEVLNEEAEKASSEQIALEQEKIRMKQEALAQKEAARQEALAQKEAARQEALAQKEAARQEALAQKEAARQEALAQKEAARLEREEARIQKAREQEAKRLEREYLKQQEQEARRLEREAREMERERQAMYRADDRGSYGRNSYGHDPYGSDPYNRDPYNRDPYNRDPYGRDPYSRDPYGHDPYGRDPYSRRDPYGRTDLQRSIEKAARSTMKNEMRTVGRSTAKNITRGVLGTSNKTAERLAGNFASSVVGDLVDSIFGTNRRRKTY